MPPRRRGNKPIDLAEVREALKDGRTWTALGLVRVPAGGSTHYYIENNDVLVEVQLVPTGEQVVCRLGASAGSLGGGAWKIPAPGTEVAVLIPTGELEADPIIVAVLATGAPPSALDADKLIIIGPKLVHIESTGDGVELVANSGGTSASLKLNSGGDVAIAAANAQNIALTVSGGGVVNVAGSSHPMLLADVLLADLASAVSTLNTVLQAGTAGGPTKQVIVQAAQWALTQLYTRLAAGGTAYKSTVANNG